MSNLLKNTALIAMSGEMLSKRKAIRAVFGFLPHLYTNICRGMSVFAFLGLVSISVR